MRATTLEKVNVAAERAAGARPLAVTGIVAAAWCAGIGLAVFTTVTLVGWVTAPRAAMGRGLPGVFRTAVDFWLVAHHAGFSLKTGRVGLLPLGLIVLPAALLYRSGGWVIRVSEVRGRRRRRVVQVAVALAVPYGALAGVLALTARSPVIAASAWEAVLAGFVLATIAGGLGAARSLAAATGRVRSGLGALLRLLPDRPRSLVIGVAGATIVLLAAGAVLTATALAMNSAEATKSYEALAPGFVGGFLLFLIELAFLPNAVIWGMAYAIGPGFSVGAGTSVSPTGVILDVVPLFPPLAALPEPGPAPLPSLLALAAPFVAGAVGGAFTIRALPSPVYEAAPLWGFVCGALTSGVVAVLAALSGGPLGGARLATVGPSAWQVGLLAALEVGISAAIAAWVTNWVLLRQAAEADQTVAAAPPSRSATSAKSVAPQSRSATSAKPAASAKPTAPPKPAPRRGPAAAAKPAVSAPEPVEFVDPEPVLGARRRPARRGGLRPEPLTEPGRPGGTPSADRRKPATDDPDGGHGSEGHREHRHNGGHGSDREHGSVPGPREAPKPGRSDGADRRRPGRAPAEPSPKPARQRRPRRHKVENRGGAIYVLKDEVLKDEVLKNEVSKDESPSSDGS